MNDVRIFPFPNESNFEAVVVIYEHHNNIFLTAYKHAVADGGSSTQVPSADLSAADNGFLQVCKEKVAEELKQSQGKRAMLT